MDSDVSPSRDAQVLGSADSERTELSRVLFQSPRHRRGRGLTLVTILAVVLVVTLGFVGGYVYSVQRSSGKSPVVNDGSTLYQAIASVNASVESVTGGPWTLEEIYGIASPIPTNPSAWGWGEYDHVLASCQHDFNGLTIWNGTIPLFTGTFNSGTAPFWQLVYFSNATHQLLVGTDVLGKITIFPPIALSSECAVSSGLGSEPWTWQSFWGQVGFPADTPAMASNAWTKAAKQYADWVGRPLSELYLFGNTYFGSGQPPANQINFYTCGSIGEVGITPGLAVYGDTGTSSFNYTLGCTPTASLSASDSAIPLQMTLSNQTVRASGGTTTILQSFEFQMNGTPPFSGPGYNMRGITSWMVGLNLSSGSRGVLPMGSSSGFGWVRSLSECSANSSGWYAVLLAPDGQWEGSYGTTANGPAWTYPVLPIVNNETIVVVVPSGWNASGDTLSVTSETSELPLTGQVMMPQFGTGPSVE